MANRDVILRAGKGTALTAAEHDQNHESMCGEVDQKTTTYEVVYTDQNKTIECSSTTAFTVTLDAVADLNTNGDTTNFKVTIKNINTGLVTVACNAADTIDGLASIKVYEGESYTLQTDNGGGTPTAWNIIASHTHANAETVPGQNLIINGAMDIWQRGTSWTARSTAIDNTRGYDADRFFLYRTTSSAWTVTVGQSTPPTVAQAGIKLNHARKLTIVADEASPAVGEYLVTGYVVEGYDIAKVIGKKATLSFWVKSNQTGTFCLSFNNATSSQSYVTEYTISSADTWEQKTITMSLETGDITPDGNWNYSSGLGLAIQWMLDANVAGSGTYTTSTTDAWQTANKLHTDNQTQLTAADTFELAAVQLEIGSTATKFQPAGRNIQEEVAMCQRYYEKSYNIGVAPGSNSAFGQEWGIIGKLVTNGQYWASSKFKVTKRNTPSVSIWTSTGTADNVALNTDGDVSAAIQSQSHNGFTLQNDTGGSYTDGQTYNYQWEADAEL